MPRILRDSIEHGGKSFFGTFFGQRKYGEKSYLYSPTSNEGERSWQPITEVLTQRSLAEVYPERRYVGRDRRTVVEGLGMTGVRGC